MADNAAVTVSMSDHLTVPQKAMDSDMKGAVVAVVSSM